MNDSGYDSDSHLICLLYGSIEAETERRNI